MVRPSLMKKITVISVICVSGLSGISYGDSVEIIGGDMSLQSAMAQSFEAGNILTVPALEIPSIKEPMGIEVAAVTSLEVMPDDFVVQPAVVKEETPKVVAEVKKKSKSGIPMDSTLKYTSGAGETTLADLVEGKKAVLLDFWATWCGPCKRLMPELEKKSQLLPGEGIEVVAVNTDDMFKAEQFIKGKNFKFRSVIEKNRGEYSRLFNINAIPCVVLLDQDGQILFNGHPQDPGLHKALAKLGVRHR